MHLKVDSMNERKSGWVWWDCLVAKRFGYFMAISLLAWPLLTAIPALEAVLSNVMLLDTYPQLFFFTFINVIALFFATAILRVLYSRYPTYTWLHALVGNGNTQWGRVRIWGVTILSVITPILLATRFGTEFEAPEICPLSSFPIPLLTTLAVSFSAVTAVGFLWMLGRLKSFLVGSQKEAENFFPFEAVQSKGIPAVAGLIDRLDRKLKRWNFSSTDIQLAVYLGLLAILHRGLLPVIEAERYVVSSAPSAIVLLLWLSGMLLSGMAHILDRYRVPVIVSLAVLLTVVFALVGSTRPFRSLTKTDSSDTSQSTVRLNIGDDIESKRIEELSKDDLPWNAVVKRMHNLGDPGPKGKTLVIVTCPGGGIHAAAWAACVLDRLCEEYEGFQESLCLISGVSGGSVGTLMFVGSRYEPSLLGQVAAKATAPSRQEIIGMLESQSPALELATRSSLEAISFGATVDDLYGLFGLPRIDRGERLERDFSGRLPETLQNKTLRDWGEKALDGRVPIVVFNATDAITGRRVLFDSVPTPTPAWEPTRNRKARPLNYRDLLGDSSSPKDVLPATAARISATFPYVSPFTKPDAPSQLGDRVALCDGGYVDNEGIVTAVTWIDHLLGYWLKESNKQPRTFDRILLLRIEPALSIDDQYAQDSSDPLSYVRWLIGPLEAMMNVRSTSQLERGHLEADLVEIYLDSSSENQPKEGSHRKDSELEKRRSQRKAKFTQEEAAQESSLSRSSPKKSMRELKQRWENELDEMVKLAKDPNQARTTKQSPEDQRDDVDDDPGSVPVVVESIRFRDAGQSIPLSWKLSKRQKLWYLLSWQNLDELNPNLRRTLSKYFTPK